MTRTLGVVALLILSGAWGVHAPFDRDEARLCTPSITMWASMGGQSGRAVLAIATDAWWGMTRVSLPFFELQEPRRDPASAMADFRSWVVENADSTAYPVAETLRGLRRSLGPGG